MHKFVDLTGQKFGERVVIRLSHQHPKSGNYCCGEYVKVGSSKDPERRLRDIRTNNPYPVELLFIDYKMGEKYWHDKLWDCLHRGEWYHYDKVCEVVDLT